jgi:hypothetical protein
VLFFENSLLFIHRVLVVNWIREPVASSLGVKIVKKQVHSYLLDSTEGSRMLMTCSTHQYYVVSGRCSYVPCMICGRGNGPAITPSHAGSPKPVLAIPHRTPSAYHNRPSGAIGHVIAVPRPKQEGAYPAHKPRQGLHPEACLP